MKEYVYIAVLCILVTTGILHYYELKRGYKLSSISLSSSMREHKNLLNSIKSITKGYGFYENPIILNPGDKIPGVIKISLPHHPIFIDLSNYYGGVLLHNDAKKSVLYTNNIGALVLMDYDKWAKYRKTELIDPHEQKSCGWIIDLSEDTEYIDY